MPLFNPDQGTVLLTGTAPPESQRLYELDGVNDPWRWSPAVIAWIGQPYAVSWTTGDVIPPFTHPVGVEELDLYVGEWSPSILNDIASGTDFNVMQSFGGSPSSTGTAVTTGTGVAFLVQYQPDYGEVPTSVPDPTLNVTDYLGTDVVVDGTYTFPDLSGDGEDSNFWIDLVGLKLYGPRGYEVSGLWPAAAALTGLDTLADYTMTGKWVFDPITAGVPPLTFANGIEPDDADVASNTVAIWYESAIGSSTVNFKGRDLNDIIRTATITLT